MSNFSAVDYLSTQVDPNTGLDSPSVEFISKFIQPRNKEITEQVTKFRYRWWFR